MNSPALPKLQVVTGTAFPSFVYGQMIDIEQCSTRLGLSVERIWGLVKEEIIPHLYIDGQGPFFRPAQVKRWAREALIQNVAGKQLKVQHVYHFRSRPTDAIPYALEPMRDKLECGPPMGEAVSAVYFLIQNNEVVYIGQTWHLLTRLADHSVQKEGKWDNFLYIPCPEDWLVRVERYWISKLRPPLNTVEHELNPRHHQDVAGIPRELVMEPAQ